MKNSLPTTAKVSKEAKECVQECVSEFISFIVSHVPGRWRSGDWSCLSLMLGWSVSWCH